MNHDPEIWTHSTLVMISLRNVLPRRTTKHITAITTSSFKPSTSRAASRAASTLTVDSARRHCLQQLSDHDRSSYILHSYVAPPARDAFLAVRAFNIDTGRIADTVSKIELAQFRFEYWRSTIQKVFAVRSSTAEVPQEPVAVLLAHALLQPGAEGKGRAITLSKRFLITLLQTREKHAGNPPFRSLDSMASYGEGTHSQLNYLLQEMMYSVSPKTTEFLNEHPDIAEQAHEVVAHIGQATGIASMLRGFSFYAARGVIPLPVQLLNSHDLSQDSLLRFLAGEFVGSSQQAVVAAGLADVVFETATRANDHLISASTQLQQIKETLANTLPDAIMVPALTAIPTKLFLERLEKFNFDLVDPKLMKKGGNANDWRLPYRSFKAYKLRAI